MNIILIGISGAGKGTQAKLLAQKYLINHISSGELFRKEFAKKSPEGIAAHEFWNKGKWVPDEVTFNLIKLYLDKSANGFVLDGFPRTVNQCLLLSDYCSAKKERITRVIYLLVSETEAVKRIKLRAVKDLAASGKCREDETDELIKARFRSFIESVNPVLDYYRDKGLLLEINGERTVEEIFAEIVSKLTEKK